MPKPGKNESKQDYLKRCTADLIEQEGREPDQAFAMCNAYWDDAHPRKAERQPINLSAAVSLVAPAVDHPTVSKSFMMTAYTGQVIDLGGFGRFAFDVSGMKAKAKIPILREHQRDRVVGWSHRAWNDGQNFYIQGQFSKSTPDSRETLSLMEEGYPWQCSVGIIPRKVKRLGTDETMELNGGTVSGPLEVWIQSDIGEVSFVSLGADDETAAIALADHGDSVTCDLLEQEEERQMTIEELKEKHPEIYQEVFSLGAQSVDVEAIRNEGINNERTRVKELMAVEGADMEARQQAISEGLSLDASYRLFFEAERGRKLQALKELKEGAPESLGYQAPVEPERIDEENLDALISGKAMALANSEKIDLGKATMRVLADNKELADRYRRRFDA